MENPGLHKIVIKRQTPSAKNSHIVTFNRSTKKPLLLPNKHYADWTEAALWQLKRYKPVANYPVSFTLIFFPADNRRRDMSNMLGAVEDVLVKAGILEDDCWQKLRPITMDMGEIDKDNPRVEIWLEEDH